jgi:membrane protein YqaA with SNARE-associated domain
LKKETKQRLRWWDLLIGITGLTITVIVFIAIAFYWNDLEKLEHLGYAGAFIISIFGGATVLAPVPMTPVIFLLGSILLPTDAPFLGPFLVGAAAGAGEAIGGTLVYLTGFAGGVFLPSPTSRFYDFYSHLTKLMYKHGTIVLFILSALINPFFYPAAVTAGAIHFGFKKYLLICWIGKTVKGITVAYAGYYGLGLFFQLLGIKTK